MGRGTWATLTNTAASRVPTAADTGHFLRVRVTYDDGEGTGKNAEQTSSEATRAVPVINRAPSFADDSTERSVAEDAPARTPVGVPVTATAGHDYQQTSGTLTLVPGETTATIGVRPIDDADVKQPETLAVG